MHISGMRTGAQYSLALHANAVMIAASTTTEQLAIQVSCWNG